jgi:hypothetical protein
MKKICINYVGQPRTFYKYYKNQFKNLPLNYKDFDIHFLFSTWENENTDIYAEKTQDIKKDIFIKKYSPPQKEEFNWDPRFQHHHSNPQFHGKGVFNYFCQLKIWNHSNQTILEYENKNNLIFDYIIQLRPDTFFGYNEESENETGVKDISIYDNLEDNTIYTPSECRFDVYCCGSVPDQVRWGKRDCILKLNHAIEIAEKIQPVQFEIHPESSLFQIIKYYGFKLEYKEAAMTCVIQT